MRHNFQISSDAIYYGGEPPPPPYSRLDVLAWRMNCAGFSPPYDVPWLNKDFTNAFLHYCCSGMVIMLWLKVIPPRGFGLHSLLTTSLFTNHLWGLISLWCIFCTPVASFDLGVNEWVTSAIEFRRIRVCFFKQGKPCLKQQTDSFPIAIRQIPFNLTNRALLKAPWKVNT